MKIDIPFEYDVSYVQKGYRTPHDVKSSSTAGLTIRDVAIKDTTLAFMVGQQVRLDHLADRFQMLGDRVPRVVEYEGRLYLETCRADEIVDVFTRPRGVNQNNPMDVGGLDAHPRHHDGPLPPPATPGAVAASFKSGTREIRVWNDDGGLWRREQMQKRCDDMFVADGNLFVLVNEPVLIVQEVLSDQDAMANKCAVGDVLVLLGEARLETGTGSRNNHASGHANSSRRFRLDRMDDAEAFAQRLAERSRKNVINVVRAEMTGGHPMLFDEEAEAVLRTAGTVVSALQDAVPQLPKKLAIAWAALREAVDNAAAGCVTPQMVEALRLTHSAFEDPAVSGWGTTRHPYVFKGSSAWGGPGLQMFGMELGTGRTIQNLQIIIDDAIGRWDARPADADWFVNALPVQAARGSGFEVFEILSRANATAAAQTLHADLSEMIDSARCGQGHLVGIVDNGKMAAGLISNEFEPLILVGSYGVEKVLPVIRERLQMLCQRNAERRMALDAEEDLGFVPTLAR